MASIQNGQLQSQNFLDNTLSVPDVAALEDYINNNNLAFAGQVVHVESTGRYYSIVDLEATDYEVLAATSGLGETGDVSTSGRSDDTVLQWTGTQYEHVDIMSDVDASKLNIAGQGLETDGAGPANLRVASAAAGDGLQGGSGAALAVDVSGFAGSYLSGDGSENLQVNLGAGVDADGSDNVRVNATGVDTGILPVAHGGTGVDGSAAAAGQLLIGNATASEYDLSTLTEGTHISVTNDDGAITIGVGVETAFDLASNDLESGTTTIWDESEGYIPQGRLQNTAITVGAGNGLLSGGDGTLALGESQTYSVNMAAVSGHGLESDGAADPSVRIDSAVISTGLAGGSGTALSLDETVLTDGGAKALDVSDLAGGAGTADQVPITDGSAVTWASLPNAGLTNDSVTASPGDGLASTGDGTLALGESETYSVVPSDFAGHGLETDGSSPPDLQIAGSALSTGLSGGSGTNLTLDENVLTDGGAKELDVADLAGGAGTADQVPVTDGAAVAWGTVPNAGLSNSSVTVAGNSVSLGSSTPVAVGDLTGNTDGLSEGTTNQFHTDERAQDAVGSIMGGNFSYSDTAPSITLLNDTVTVAGNDVTLGSSTTVALADLSDVGTTTVTDGDVLAADGTEIASEAITSLTENHVNISDLKNVDPTVNNTLLTNSSVTVAGNAVSLGASTTIAIADLSDVTGITALEENTTANKPAAGTEGRLFVNTTDEIVEYDNGSAWVQLGVANQYAQDQSSNYKDGGDYEIDVAEFSGGKGTDGQVPMSDGASVSWTTLENSALTNDTITVTPGNGLQSGGDSAITLGGSETYSVDLAALSGHGIEPNGSAPPSLRIDAAALSTGISGGSGTNLSIDETVLTDGGAKALDVADLAGAAGASSEVPVSDGAAVSWGTVANSSLTNDTVTVGGNAVSLGGSTTISVGDLSDVTGVAALTQDTEANRPAASTTGRIYVGSDTRAIYRDTGTAWELIGTAPANLGASDVGLGNVENIALSAATWTDMGISRGDVSKSDVGLASVPNTDIAYSSTIPADSFTSSEVTNLRAGQLEDGTTPWTSNNYFDGADARTAVEGTSDVADLSSGLTTTANYVPISDGLGNVSWADPETHVHSKYTDSDAQGAVSANDVGLGSVENIALSNAGWTDIGISQSDVSASDVGLGNVPDTDATDASNITSGTLPSGRLSGTYSIDISGDADTLDGTEGTNYARTDQSETFSNGVTIQGDLAVEGTTFTTQSETVQITDNLLLLNQGEVGTGISEGTVGLEADRGDGEPIKLIYEESSQALRVGVKYQTIAYSGLAGTFEYNEKIVGQSSGANATVRNDTGSSLQLKGRNGTFTAGETIEGQASAATATADSITTTDQTQASATREDSPEDTGVPFWNSTRNRMDTSSDITWSGSELSVTGSIDFSGSITTGGSSLGWSDLGISQGDVSQSNVGLGNVENIALSTAGWTNIGISQSDVGKGDVGLSNVPNTDIAYASTIPADAFTSAEVTNLRSGKLDDGTTPWTANNYFDGADARMAVEGTSDVADLASGLTNNSGYVPASDGAGGVSWADPETHVHSKYTDSDAQGAVSAGDVGLGSVENVALSTAGWADIGISQGDVSKSNVGLGSVPNTNIAYASTIPADAFTSTEVTNLRSGALADGTEPWGSNDSYSNSDARNAVEGTSDVADLSSGLTANSNYVPVSDGSGNVSWDDPETHVHSKYTDSDAQSAVSASNVGLGNVENVTLSAAGWADIGISQSDVGKGDVGLGSVPNTNIAYSSTIPADAFTAAEVTNLRNGQLEDGSTPWTSNNNYIDSDARSAVEGTSDVADLTSGLTNNSGYMPISNGTGGVSWDNPESHVHSKYTDADARGAVSASDVGLGSVENVALSTAGWTDIGISQSDISKSDVNLGSVPNTDIAYSSTIPADSFTSTEVSNLRSGQLDDGSTPWTSNNNYTDADARGAVQSSITHVGLDNIEFGNITSNEGNLAYDDSEGLKMYWNGSWRQIFSEGPTASSAGWSDLAISQSDISASNVGLGNVDNKALSNIGWTDLAISQGDISKSNVGLGNVPNTNIAYSSTIPADAFTSTEVSNLRSGQLDDGTTPWTSNNYFDGSDARSAVGKSDVGLGSVPNTDATNASNITSGTLSDARLPSTVSTGTVNVSDFTFSQDAGEMVIKDNNGVELIRQPKAGPTRFIQGAEIGTIGAPEDSFTQVINAASTSAASAGDAVGYTLSVDNQSFLEISAEADGSGGIQNGDIYFNRDLRVGTNKVFFSDNLAIRERGDVDGRFRIADGSGQRADAEAKDVYIQDASTWAGNHINSTSDPHNVTASQVGLGSVENKALSNASWSDLAISQGDISKSNVGLGSVENIALSNAGWSDLGISTTDISRSDINLGSAGWADLGISQSDVSKSNVGLGSVPNTNFESGFTTTGTITIDNPGGDNIRMGELEGSYPTIEADNVLRVGQRVEIWGTSSGSYFDVRDTNGNVGAKITGDGSESYVGAQGGQFTVQSGLDITGGSLQVDGSKADWGDLGISRTDVSKSDVGLGNLSNTDYWTIEEGDGEQTNIHSGQKLEIYGGGGLNAEITSSGSESRLRLAHNNTSSQGNVSTGGATVIDDINVDGYGHVTGMNTQNRSLDDWANANSAINLGGNDIHNVRQIDGSGGNHRIRFDSDNSYIEFTDQSNSRSKIVTQDTYIDAEGAWLSDDDLIDINAGGGLTGGGSTGLTDQMTISHADTSGQGNVNTGGAAVIDDIHTDGYGHVTNMNTENRSLDDWQSANNDVSLGGNDLNDVGNFNIEHNSASDSLDFVYTG